MRTWEYAVRQAFGTRSIGNWIYKRDRSYGWTNPQRGIHRPILIPDATTEYVAKVDPAPPFEPLEEALGAANRDGWEFVAFLPADHTPELHQGHSVLSFLLRRPFEPARRPAALRENPENLQARAERDLPTG